MSVDADLADGYASTNMQLFYMLKSYDYIILDIFILFYII